MLEALLRAEGAVLGNDDLIEQVWEEDTSYSTNAVRVTLSKLRAKLGEPPLIETVPGAGYRIAGPAKSPATGPATGGSADPITDPR